MRSLENLSLYMIGASGGIGSACCCQLARPGVNFALCSIDGPGLEALASTLREKGATVFSRVVDICDEAQVKSFIQDAHKKLGSADVLINFAGLSVTASVEDLTEADYDLVMDVNIKGMFFDIKHFIPLVDESKGAVIVSFGSMASKRANPAAPHYSAAKAAVNMFMAGLAQKYKDKNIRFTVFNPGPTNTTFFEGRIPADKRGDFMQAQDVAEVMEFVLTRDSRIVFHDIMFDSFAFFQR